MPIVNQTDYSGMKAAMFSWLTDFSGLGTGKVQWANQDFSRVTKPYAVLQRIGQASQIGLPAVTRELNGEILESTYVTEKRMMLQVDVYTNAADDNDDLEAMDFLEQAIGALNFQRVVNSFNAVGLVYQTNDGIVNADDFSGNRWERRAVATLTLAYKNVLFDDGTDDPPDDGQWIKRVEMTINDEDPFPIDADAGIFSSDFTADFL